LNKLHPAVHLMNFMNLASWSEATTFTLNENIHLYCWLQSGLKINMKKWVYGFWWILW